MPMPRQAVPVRHPGSWETCKSWTVWSSDFARHRRQARAQAVAPRARSSSTRQVRTKRPARLNHKQHKTCVHGCVRGCVGQHSEAHHWKPRGASEARGSRHASKRRKEPCISSVRHWVRASNEGNETRKAVETGKHALGKKCAYQGHKRKRSSSTLSPPLQVQPLRQRDRETERRRDRVTGRQREREKPNKQVSVAHVFRSALPPNMSPHCTPHSRLPWTERNAWSHIDMAEATDGCVGGEEARGDACDGGFGVAVASIDGDGGDGAARGCGVGRVALASQARQCTTVPGPNPGAFFTSTTFYCSTALKVASMHSYGACRRHQVTTLTQC